MSWGIELWDQYDNIAKHTQTGIDFCETYSNFIRQRSECELAYAKSLRKLVKNFFPKKKHEDSEFSLHLGFNRLLTEVNDLAGQHESISEKLADEVAKNILKLAAELRQERRTFLSDGDVHSRNLQTSLDHLDKTKKTYEKAFKQSCQAVEKFHMADADLNLSRAEVERSKNVMHNKETIGVECKSAYAKQLESTNALQRDHYTKHIPSVFHSLQQMDERRIQEVAASMRNSAEVHLKVLPIVQKCLDGMVTASSEVDPAKDSEIVIGRYKSGFNPPGDIPFEDLSSINLSNNNGINPGSNNSIHSSTSQESPAHQPSPVNKSNTMKGRKNSKTVSTTSVEKAGTMGGKKQKGTKQSVMGLFQNKNKGEETEDFKHLPPTQRQKRLQAKIDALNSQIKKEAEERDAMTRMSELYTKNPSLGDAAPLVLRLAENQKNLDGLLAELAKYQGFMHEVEAQLNQLSGSNQDLSPGGGDFRHSTSDLSMASNSTGGGGESANAGSGGASSTHSGNAEDPGEVESSTPSTPQPPHHVHRKAPMPPPTAEADVRESAPEPRVDKATSGPDSDLRDSGQESSGGSVVAVGSVDVGNIDVNYELPPEPIVETVDPVVVHVVNEEDLPEPPSYPPPPPPPEEDEFEFGSAQEIDPSPSYSPESGYIGDVGCPEEDPPAISRCRALYSFQAENAGTIHMIEGEELDVIEEDQGDGWTRVRRPQPRSEMDDGFVPTSYLELDI